LAPRWVKGYVGGKVGVTVLEGVNKRSVSTNTGFSNSQFLAGHVIGFELAAHRGIKIGVAYTLANYTLDGTSKKGSSTEKFCNHDSRSLIDMIRTLYCTVQEDS